MRLGGARFITGAVDRWTAVPVLLACASLWLLLNPRPPTLPRNPHHAAEVHAVEKGPALEVSKVFSLDYLDRGDKIELSINSSANPVPYVDVNQDGLLDKSICRQMNLMV